MQFADYLIFANARPGRVFIVANSDIYFDETLTRLNCIDLTDALVCLSRTEMNKKAPCWNFSHYGDPHYHGPNNSQDAWIFRAPLKSFTCDWTMGVPGCDNKLAYEAAAAGLRLVNPWPEIRAWHNHASRVRRMQPGAALPGPYRDVAPGKL
jgi:hypothetical protein